MISHDVLVCLNLNGLINAFVLALIFLLLQKNLPLSLKLISLQMLLGCFWICGCLDQIVKKFALEAVLHSFENSEFGIVIRYFLSDSERGRKLKTEGYFWREQLS